MDENGNIHEIADDILQDFHDPIEEDPMDDIETKRIKKQYREMESRFRKLKTPVNR